MTKVHAALSTALVAAFLVAAPASRSTATDAPRAMTAAASGKVVETVNAGGYTYVQVDTGTTKMWAAAPQFSVAVGDSVSVPSGMEMRDFTSKALNRTFDVISFVQQITVAGAKPDAAGALAAHAKAPGGDDDGKSHTGAPKLDVSGLPKAEGGQTVADLFAKRSSLVGKEVVVRGKVAKYTANVMGKNWLHVQDGSGGSGTNDVTVTTSATTAVGQTVLVRGKLVADKDLGAGYKYDILIEDASVTTE